MRDADTANLVILTLVAEGDITSEDADFIREARVKLDAADVSNREMIAAWDDLSPESRGAWLRATIAEEAAALEAFKARWPLPKARKLWKVIDY